ncbi:MAG: MATE family efflux transporter [Chitinispirillaceae bacterium]|nr:MATE family efflux transporter [Chitinispirillaceae bacterium]
MGVLFQDNKNGENLLPYSIKELLKISAPLVIEMGGVMLIQIIDAIFLSWHSAEAVAAAITAGLASWLCICVFSTTAGFTSTLVAHYLGANQEEKILRIIINGIYFSIFSSGLVGILGFFVPSFFKWAGHQPIVMEYEILYFSIIIGGAFFPIAGASISGYFYGTANTPVIMVGQLIAIIINSILDYLLILGKLGFPKLGVKGAAIATLLSEASTFIFISMVFYFSINKKKNYWKKSEGNRSLFSFDPEITWKIIKFGFPNGIRAFIEMLAWTIFPFFVGRIGTLELAASNIAYRINSIAIFPVLGLSTAVSILTGRAQGAKRPDISVEVWKRGLLLGLLFTLILAITYFLFPHKYYLIFYNNNTLSSTDFAKILEHGRIMLKLIALYSMFDTMSIITLGFLQGVGDTQWTMRATILFYTLFVAILFLIDFLNGDLKVLWIVATIFVILQSIIWIFRFIEGRWKEIELVNN